jgi:D-alanine-D-alanine ligase-like ATP-grasp enzyme
VRIDRPANVLGDGARSVEELVAGKNEERRRRALPTNVPIEIDAEALRFLTVQGLDPASRPAAGLRVWLRGTSNINTGAEAIDCSTTLDRSYIRQVESFCGRVPKLQLVAVDAMIRDPAQPAARGNYQILELNGAPGFASFHYPWEGEPQDAAGSLLDRLIADRW